VLHNFKIFKKKYQESFCVPILNVRFYELSLSTICVTGRIAACVQMIGGRATHPHAKTILSRHGVKLSWVYCPFAAVLLLALPVMWIAKKAARAAL